VPLVLFFDHHFDDPLLSLLMALLISSPCSPDLVRLKKEQWEILLSGMEKRAEQNSLETEWERTLDRSERVALDRYFFFCLLPSYSYFSKLMIYFFETLLLLFPFYYTYLFPFSVFFHSEP